MVTHHFIYGDTHQLTYGDRVESLIIFDKFEGNTIKNQTKDKTVNGSFRIINNNNNNNNRLYL